MFLLKKLIYLPNNLYKICNDSNFDCNFVSTLKQIHIYMYQMQESSSYLDGIQDKKIFIY